ncbi:hypothetical protein MAR_032100 [Mya arenaria]|uniref:Uncharacterized protein n=1 Tax=Mya arenaria TaxID=6604 RepID=A0ABY7F926_MYAAR|nr:hypothetical protein MAR_032100 [Mya arenaria]
MRVLLVCLGLALVLALAEGAAFQRTGKNTARTSLLAAKLASLRGFKRQGGPTGDSGQNGENGEGSVGVDGDGGKNLCPPPTSENSLTGALDVTYAKDICPRVIDLIDEEFFECSLKLENFSEEEKAFYEEVGELHKMVEDHFNDNQGENPDKKKLRSLLQTMLRNLEKRRR